MWSAAPKHLFSSDFIIRDANHQSVAEVRLSSWRERGAVTCAGVEHKVLRQSAFGAFVLEKGGAVVARAEKPSAFHKTFTIEYEGRQYTLKARSLGRRELVLYENEREVGAIAPEGPFTRRARVALPEDLSLLLRLFVIWLTMLIWKRNSDAAE